MVQKGIVSTVLNDGSLVTVTPFSGGMVTVPLVVPNSLTGLLPVGTHVWYALGDDRTGIILHREDGEWPAGGDGQSGEVALVDRTTGEAYIVYVDNGDLSMEIAPETWSARASDVTLTDRTTGQTYTVYVDSGKLFMEGEE